MNANTPLHHLLSAATPLPLNQKAMLVKLTTSKPSTSHSFDPSLQKAARQLVGDAGAELKGNLWIDPASPVRILYALQGALYRFHRENTLPYEDRGARLLPLSRYEHYTQEARAAKAHLDAELKGVLARYDDLVQADIRLRRAEAELHNRTSPASLADYPTAEQFAASFDVHFMFSPLPDQSHWLFDINEEDKATLSDQLAAIEKQAQDDLRERVRAPLVKLIEKLRIPIKEKGSIFRDSAVENITEQIALARALCMGDPAILAMCDEVSAVTAAFAKNPDVLRESPVVRSAAADRLAAVADKMSAFM